MYALCLKHLESHLENCYLTKKIKILHVQKQLLKHNLSMSSRLFTFRYFITSSFPPTLNNMKQNYSVEQLSSFFQNAIKSLSKLAEFIGYPRDEALLTEIQEKCTVNKMKDVEKTRDSGTFIASGEGISKLYRKGLFCFTLGCLYRLID